jgi:1-acyl-sn-glycerol-3-phosphate acyltransferase
MNLNALCKSLMIFPRTLNYLQQTKVHKSDIEKIKFNWAHELMQRLNIQVEVIGKPSADASILLLGNHISYVDIPLLFKYVPQASFVAKKEVKSWPIIGAAARQARTVFVDRNNNSHRSHVRESIHQALTDGKRVIIFPSGTTSISEHVAWKKGAFEIARDGGFKVQPFRINYSPLRDVAYIDQDTLIFHLMKLSQHKVIHATLEFHEPVYIKDVYLDAQYWQQWSQPQLLTQSIKAKSCIPDTKTLKINL